MQQPSALGLEFFVFFAEAFDATSGVHQFLFSCIKGMALGANFHADVLLGRARRNFVSAGAPDNGLVVSRVYIFFHGRVSSLCMGGSNLFEIFYYRETDLIFKHF
jgi:hypothetical protein